LLIGSRWRPIFNDEIPKGRTEIYKESDRVLVFARTERSREHRSLSILKDSFIMMHLNLFAAEGYADIDALIPLEFYIWSLMSFES
jgi:hypothetical protein